MQGSSHMTGNIIELGKPLDDFETEFQLLRSESHKLRDLIMKRAGVIEKNGAKDKEAISK